MLEFHHLRKRAKISNDLESYPSDDFGKRIFDYVMIGVGLAAPIAIIPQIVQLYTTKSGDGLSLATWAFLAFFNLLWATYGKVHRENIIILANVLMFFCNSAIVVGILLY